MLRLIDFDLASLSQQEAKSVQTLRRKGYNYGWLQPIARYEGITMDDIPAYKISGRSGLYTISELRDYSYSHRHKNDNVFIYDADDNIAGIT